MYHPHQHTQNFLKSSELIAELVGRTNFGAQDTVLDIGAGTGSIAAIVAERCNKVIAYETDGRLVEQLKQSFRNQPKVAIVYDDFLEVDLPPGPYKVFSNIPFNRTSDILHKLFDTLQPPTESYLIMQREAALKFMGTPGKESLTSILHKPWFDMTITHRFHPSDFSPAPRVDIALLRVVRRGTPLVKDYQKREFMDLVSYVFNHANPNITPSLQKLFPGRSFSMIEPIFGADVTAKPSQITLKQWLRLHNAIRQVGSIQTGRLIGGSAAKLQNEARHIEKYHRTRISKNWRAEAIS